MGHTGRTIVVPVSTFSVCHWIVLLWKQTKHSSSKRKHLEKKKKKSLQNADKIFAEHASWMNLVLGFSVKVVSFSSSLLKIPRIIVVAAGNADSDLRGPISTDLSPVPGGCHQVICFLSSSCDQEKQILTEILTGKQNKSHSHWFVLMNSGEDWSWYHHRLQQIRDCRQPGIYLVVYERCCKKMNCVIEDELVHAQDYVNLWCHMCHMNLSHTPWLHWHSPEEIYQFWGLNTKSIFGLWRFILWSTRKLAMSSSSKVLHWLLESQKSDNSRRQWGGNHILYTPTSRSPGLPRRDPSLTHGTPSNMGKVRCQLWLQETVLVSWKSLNTFFDTKMLGFHDRWPLSLVEILETVKW